MKEAAIGPCWFLLTTVACLLLSSPDSIKPAPSSLVPPPCSSRLVLLLVLLLCPEVWSYEAPEGRQDVFARRACPAFLTFTNAAYLAGVTVELPCHCKPHQVQSVMWFFRKHLDNSQETRALSDDHGNKVLDSSRVPHSRSLQSRFSIRLFSLLIFRAGQDDSGLYICGSSHRDFFYAYDLDIQQAHTLRLTPRLNPETTNKEMKTRKRLGSVQLRYQVFTSFRSWSVCDRCGVPGEQVRVGLCYIHSHFLHIRFRRANQTVASCSSGAVPRAFRYLNNRRVGAQLEVKSCQVTCPSKAPQSSRISALMAFLGYNSSSLSAEAAVFYLSHPADHVLTLGCPGARPNMAVAWDQGSKPIYRSDHSAGHKVSATAPRLQIDTGHHLVFNPAKMQDSGVYYCWLQGHQAAEIHLLVYAHLGRGQSVTSRPDFPAAVRSVLISYAVMTAIFCFLVFCKAGVRHLRDDREAHID